MTDYLYNNTITYGTRAQLSKMTMPSTIATFVNVGVFLEKAKDMTSHKVATQATSPEKEFSHP